MVNSNIRRGLLTILIFSSFGYGDEPLNLLLQRLGQEDAYYKKTVDESAGIVQVYTREDLDRMQAHTLKDVLKSIRFVSYEEGILGEAILATAGAFNPLSAMYRLYIDGHEVSSPIFGSAMYQFAEMDLGFVDHIEVYQGGNAIAFGNEPGMMTIRVYSKDPRREGGSTLSVRGDSLGGGSASLCLTGVDEEESYLAYLSGDLTRRDKVEAHGRSYSKDRNSMTFYGKYERTKRFRFVAAHFQNKKDAFLGIGMHQTPEGPNEITWRHSFVDLSWQLPYRTVFELSADYSRHRMQLDDPGGIRFPSPSFLFTHFDGEYAEEVYKASLKGDYDHRNGSLRWGVEGIEKRYSILHAYYDSVNLTDPEGPDRLSILSAYGEESWHLTPSDLLIGTLKVDHLRDNDRRDDTEHSLRLGWIHLFSINSSFKLFYNRTYLYPGFGYTSSYLKFAQGNPELESEHFQNVMGEWKYETGRSTLKIGVLRQEKNHAIVIDPQRKIYVNSPRHFSAGKVYLDYSYAFTPEHRIELEYYRGWFLQDLSAKSPLSGGYLRLYDTFGSWELYQELIYRQGYTFSLPSPIGTGSIEIHDGWDYTVALQWHPRHDLTLSLKGENLLNSTLRSPVFGLGATPVIDRKITLGVEYFF